MFWPGLRMRSGKRTRTRRKRMILGEANSERDWARAKVGSNAEAMFQCRVRFRERKKRENKAGYTTLFFSYKNLVYKNIRLQNRPKFKNMLRTCQGLV